MALYAAARLQKHIEAGGDPNAEATVHVLYAASRRVVTLTFTLASALAVVQPIVTEATQPIRNATPCDYCGWCARKLTCDAMNERAQAVNAGRDDWKLATYHASEIATPSEMAKALDLARHLKKWAAAVEHFAAEMAIRNGVTIPGNEVATRAGKSSCADVLGAFRETGLDATEFLKCCDLRMNSSKENPDKKGLAEVYAAAQGISKAAATRQLKTKLAPYMRTPKQITYLKPTNSTDEEETNA